MIISLINLSINIHHIFSGSSSLNIFPRKVGFYQIKSHGHKIGDDLFNCFKIISIKIFIHDGFDHF